MGKDSIMAICTERSSKNPPATVGIWVPCMGCQKDVWLSDSTIKSMKEQHPNIDLVKNPPEPFCMTCGLKKIAEMEEPAFMKPGKAQTEEIIDVIRKDSQSTG